ncbi:MAG: Transcriptional regulator [bacterium]|nr:Transcriptional regulator [bacterium]
MLASRLEMSFVSVRKALGARLKQLREEQGLKVENVAHWVGVDRTHVYGIERGDTWPSVELLVSLASAYRVDPADLLIFPEQHVRHRFRELARLIPNAKLAAVIALVEKHLGVSLEELTTAGAPVVTARKKTK